MRYRLINQRSLEVLRVLLNNKDINLTKYKLAKLVRMEPSNLHLLLNNFINKNIIECVESGRCRFVKLAEKGESVTRELLQIDKIIS